MKYELKIEIRDSKKLRSVIEESYFDEKNYGKITKKVPFIIDKDDPLYIVFKGLNNITIRITNEELIEGSIRFIVDESSDVINLFPFSTYCIIENQKYSFY